jgi:hypothetical protein
MLSQCISVHRDKDGCAVLLSKSNAICKRNKYVLSPGHPDAVFPGALKLSSEHTCRRQRDALFVRAVHADGARVFATVTGIDHHQRALLRPKLMWRSRGPRRPPVRGPRFAAGGWKEEQREGGAAEESAASDRHVRA